MTIQQFKASIWAAIERANFDPHLLGLLVNPFYFARAGLRDHVATLGHHMTGLTLDVGCGTKPYEHLCASTKYVGLEIDTIDNRAYSKADCFYDGTIFPFEPETFDSVLINQVFEHVFNPEEFLEEVRRVMKHGATLLMTVPFVWDEHLQPHDFGRYSSFGLTHLLEKHGFRVLELRKSVNDIRVIFQLLNDYTYKITHSEKPRRNLLLTLLLMSPVNLVGVIAARILPANDDLYLDNVVLATKDVRPA
jgi:SAM-dependent methyltransferase